MLAERDLIHMIWYKKRRIIAASVLIPVLLVLLLSLHFRIWSGSYTEGDLESIVVQQMDSLEKANKDESISDRICLHFCECICLSAIGTMAFLLCELFLAVCLKALPFRPSVTLCSLSVRMDD